MNVYHFTKFEYLLKIIKSGKLFFSDLKYSNDPSEGLYPSKIIEDCLQDLCENQNEFCKIISFFNVNTISYETLSVYSISLTSRLPNIHMWMEYGDYARGVAIAFNLEKLSNLLCNETDVHLAIRPVQYDKKAVRKFIEDAYNQNNSTNNFLEMESKILALYPFIKDKAYKTEKEFRISFVSSEPDISPNSDRILFGWDYGTRHYYLNVMYLIETGVIKTVFLGSNLTLYEKKILQDELKKLNLDIQLRTILIPVSKKEGK